MYYPGYNSGNVVFSEGNWFPFRVYNCVQLQDGEYYYVLQDINGLKHFLPAQFYKEYRIKTGEEIQCRIDKINCTGRIILEPKHPYYSEGEVYLFTVVGYKSEGDQDIVIVQEFSGNCIEVPLYGKEKLNINTQTKLKCIVKNIKKGIIKLEIYSTNI